MTDLKDKLNKIYWHRDLAMHGHERNGMSPELSEALRNEIRTALEAGGKSFDVNVARRVYDLAIAARDMCIAASGSVKEAIDQIKETSGPMESLDSSDTPESQAQASESFGARLIREILAVMPALTRPHGEDPKALVHALAEARASGMHDVAEELEKKLFGRVLSGPRPIDTSIDVDVGSFEHGFADGKIGALVPSAILDSPEYENGYKEGTKKRLLEAADRPGNNGTVEATP